MKVAADILTEFLEVAFHSLLYVRDLYPCGVFQRRKKYDVPIYICVHPEVKQYIIDLLNSLKPLLENSRLECISFVIFNRDQKPIEKFVFEINTFDSEDNKEMSYMMRLERTLRAFLLKLYVCEAELIPKPEGCSWNIQVHTKESAVLEMEEKQLMQDFTWVEADGKTTSLGDCNMIPLKAMDSSIFKMQMFVEELPKKE